MKKTKKNYEKYLNELGLGLSNDEFIVGGKIRHGKYGSMLRKHDPIAFMVGFREWTITEE